MPPVQPRMWSRVWPYDGRAPLLGWRPRHVPDSEQSHLQRCLPGPTLLWPEVSQNGVCPHIHNTLKGGSRRAEKSRKVLPNWGGQERSRVGHIRNISPHFRNLSLNICNISACVLKMNPVVRSLRCGKDDGRM